MKKRKALIISIYLIAFCMIGRLSTPKIIVDVNQIRSSAQFIFLNRNIGIPWDKLSDKEKAGYYERILLNIFGPYIRNEIKNYYGEARQYWNAYTGTSGRRFRKHPDTKPDASGHFAG